MAILCVPTFSTSDMMTVWMGHSVERSSSTMQALGPQKSASQQNSSTTPSQLWNTMITFHAQIQAQQFSTGLGYGGVAGISESDWVSSNFSSNSRMWSFKCSSADILWAIEYPLAVVTAREGDPNFWRELLSYRIGIFCLMLTTVEPLYNGHHWEPMFCPYCEVSLTQGLLVYFQVIGLFEHKVAAFLDTRLVCRKKSWCHQNLVPIRSYWCHITPQWHSTLLLTSVSQQPSSSGCCWLQLAHLSLCTV